MTRTWIDRRLCPWCERETDCEVLSAEVVSLTTVLWCLHCLRRSICLVLASDPFAYRAASA